MLFLNVHTKCVWKNENINTSAKMLIIITWHSGHFDVYMGGGGHWKNVCLEYSVHLIRPWSWTFSQLICFFPQTFLMRTKAQWSVCLKKAWSCHPVTLDKQEEDKLTKDEVRWWQLVGMVTFFWLCPLVPPFSLQLLLSLRPAAHLLLAHFQEQSLFLVLVESLQHIRVDVHVL